MSEELGVAEESCGAVVVAVEERFESRLVRLEAASTRSRATHSAASS